MGGFFGVVSQEDCVLDLFYGIDYHSHLGNKRAGILVRQEGGFGRYIHDIRNDQFRAKFGEDIKRLKGRSGIGCISDYDDQPLKICGSLGRFGITMVGLINNLKQLREEAFQNDHAHFAESVDDELNPTELVASLICEKKTFGEGIQHVQEKIDGSCSLLLLTDDGIYAARDRFGRTPVVIGKRGNDLAVAFEASALYNLGYHVCRWLGPGEIVLMTPEGLKDISPARKILKMCTFMWIYYGFPASSYEGINAEAVRYRCGEALARRDAAEGYGGFDAVAGVPDSGTAHALGYANSSGLPYRRSLVKYTPTWPRSFIGDTQRVRLNVAKMKLIPIKEFITGQSLLFCEDSIVRGTQLKDTFARLPEWGVKEVHVRSACPPIMFCCKYLNFSPSRTPLELVARRAVKSLSGEETPDTLPRYCDSTTPEYAAMVEWIRKDMGFTSLKYQYLDDMINAIGIPRDQLCTYCWDGKE